jgi:dTDP-4-dehydrorhamnose reductase
MDLNSSTNHQPATINSNYASSYKRVLILGAQGRLGTALLREWQAKADGMGLSEVLGFGRTEVDFSDPLAAVKMLEAQELQEGDLIVNCAAATDVDGCEGKKEWATTINATTPGFLAQLASERGARFLHISTDYVFDGKLDRSYRETDLPAPLSHYGATKLAGEEAVMAASPHHVIARVSWVFGPDRPSFVDQILKRALTNDSAAAVHDKISSPAYTNDLAAWLPIFFKAEAPGGIYHLCNSGSCSWRDYGEYALQAAERHGIPVLTTTVAALKLSEMTHFIAERPVNTALDTSKFSKLYGKPLRSWQEAVEEHVKSNNF